MAVVSVSLPESLVGQMDGFIGARAYAGRSELVRAALRDFLAREDQDDNRGARSATLTLMYPEGAERKLGQIRHDHSDIVHSMMHGHAGDRCVDVFVLEGPGRRIRAFADALRAARETQLVQAVYTDVGPEP